MEQGIAESLHLKLGDTLTYDIAGAPVTAPIRSLRKVDWDSFRPNFFTLFAPGRAGIVAADLSRRDSPAGRSASAAWLSNLVQQYPNVLAIDVGEILRQIQTIIGAGGEGGRVRVPVHAAGRASSCCRRRFAATQDERRFDAAILRTPRRLAAPSLPRRKSRSSWCWVRLAGTLAAAGATGARLCLVGSRVPDPLFGQPDGLALWWWAAARSL
jgi:putative ABC transport system permease protein